MVPNDELSYRLGMIEQFFRTGKKYTAAEMLGLLNPKLEKKGYAQRSHNTLLRDFDRIRDKGISIPTEGKARKTVYFYEDPAESISDRKAPARPYIRILEKVLPLLKKFNGFDLEDDIRELINTLENRMKFAPEDVQEIVFPQRQPETKGTEHLDYIYQAILDKRVLKMVHRKHGGEIDKEFLVHPYIIVQYDGRWYLRGQIDGMNKCTTFGLDRVKEVKRTKHSYLVCPDEDPYEHFRDIIGIMVPEDQPVEELVLLFDKFSSPHAMSRTWHHSYTLIDHCHGCARISYRVKKNTELLREIRAYGPGVKVIAPAHLAETIRRDALETARLYSKWSVVE
jgi:predicted DNA-binding transcriptional regulator YafY